MVQFVLGQHSTFYYLAYWTTLGVQYAFEYAHRHRQGEVRASQLQTQLAQATLHNLQARLQPHFLFNTLNTITAMVRERRAEEACDVLARLAQLLRQSLKQGADPTIPLGRELEFLGNYLEIARARYPDRLSYRIEHAATLDGLSVPTLILQPLVENAVVHGLSRGGAGLELVVRSRRENGRLVLSVDDNGPGLPDDFDLDASEGFGLSSTRARLDTLYGGRARLSLQPLTPSGVRAELCLPLVEAPGA
jgi:LytS/YehU family sensor histidine kinase